MVKGKKARSGGFEASSRGGGQQPDPSEELCSANESKRSKSEQRGQAVFYLPQPTLLRLSWTKAIPGTRGAKLLQIQVAPGG